LGQGSWFLARNGGSLYIGHGKGRTSVMVQSMQIKNQGSVFQSTKFDEVKHTMKKPPPREHHQATQTREELVSWVDEMLAFFHDWKDSLEREIHETAQEFNAEMRRGKDH
jgi:hypothetical protein